MEKFGYKLDEAINLFVLFKNTGFCFKNILWLGYSNSLFLYFLTNSSKISKICINEKGIGANLLRVESTLNHNLAKK